jgi:hypothetical protein
MAFCNVLVGIALRLAFEKKIAVSGAKPWSFAPVEF